MLCPRCYGKHVVVLNGSHLPCPECAGVGSLHCCDGLGEQGECRVPAPRPEAAARAEEAPAARPRA